MDPYGYHRFIIIIASEAQTLTVKQMQCPYDTNRRLIPAPKYQHKQYNMGDLQQKLTTVLQHGLLLGRPGTLDATALVMLTLLTTDHLLRTLKRC